jgi:hypothetical protein
MVLLAPFVSINSVNLSAAAKSMEITPTVEKGDKTAGNTAGMKSPDVGLESCIVKVKFVQGFGAGGVHETLRAAHKTVVAVELRYSTAAVGTTNPKLTGNALVIYMPAGGPVGQSLEAEAELTFDGAYTWATS